MHMSPYVTGKFKRCIECIYGGSNHALVCVKASGLEIQSIDSLSTTMISARFPKSSFASFQVQTPENYKIQLSLLYEFLRKFNQESDLTFHSTSSKGKDRTNKKFEVTIGGQKLLLVETDDETTYFTVSQALSGPQFIITPMVFSTVIVYLAVNGGISSVDITPDQHVWTTKSETGSLVVRFDVSESVNPQYQILTPALKPYHGRYLTKFLKQTICLCNENVTVTLSISDEGVMKIKFDLGGGVAMDSFFVPI